MSGSAGGRGAEISLGPVLMAVFATLFVVVCGLAVATALIWAILNQLDVPDLATYVAEGIVAALFIWPAILFFRRVHRIERDLRQAPTADPPE